MSKSKNRPAPRPQPAQPSSQKTAAATAAAPGRNWLLPLLVALAATATVLSPMLSNQFTNWDDHVYVTENPLLAGPDWHGIFTQPVSSNYHPLTVASLALNYQASKLAPFSYFLVNWLLHLLNVGLVFWLVFLLSGRDRWVAGIVALFFGIHPMHVESVAWISERKDVLYTAFFLPSLIFYWKYLESGRMSRYWVALGMFGISLLCKPAAVVLPVVLLLFDLYKGREWTRRVFLEKLPFFALALAFGLVAMNIQSEKAIAKPEFYDLPTRLLFGFYSFAEYVRRVFWWGPLSSFHPFPPGNQLPGSYYVMPVVGAAFAAALWFFRKNRLVVFSLGFFVVNLALILQFPITFGNCIIAERYTYVAYIGPFFLLAMLWAAPSLEKTWKNALLGLFALGAVACAAGAFDRTKDFKNNEALWGAAIEAYPHSYIAHANRAHHYLTGKQFDKALADLNAALQAYPDHIQSLQTRINVNLEKNQNEAALADADHLTKVDPNGARGWLFRGFAEARLGRDDDAIADYTRAQELDPNDYEAFGNRGATLFNKKQRYAEAEADFNRALELKPGHRTTLANRARARYMLGKKEEAKADFLAAEKQGEVFPADFKKLLFGQ